ncbi:leucine-rich repeat protein [Clostridium beijerinckii]|uniref:leucine-rich repeat protein n=1 Tax=Clostridium beijerinckii TaxID=1520 RepID=UPI0022E7B3E7|nr:leucine-rich repeat protein [Clostridium beijerinckii]
MKSLRLIKVIASSLVVASVLALNPIGASAEWKQDFTGWWYKEGSSWATGWKLINSKWYYFDSKGYMAKDTTIDGYYLNDSGAWTELTTSGNFKFDKSTGTIVEYTGSDSSAVIPDKINGTEVKRIRFTSSSSCKNLTSITIPDSTTSIESIVCMNCSNLTSIVIPNSVTNIKADAFSGCSSLKSITIPSSVKTIESRAFAGCNGLTSLTIPNSVTSIGNEVFQQCSNLTSITISGSVKSMGCDVFGDCVNLKSVTISDGITSINQSQFQGCYNLTSVKIPNSVTSIGRDAFRFCNEAQFYVSSETTKQLLVNSGVSESQIIVSA